MKTITILLLLLSTSVQLNAVQKIAVINNGDWSNPLTWGGSVPGDNDTIVIPAGITVDVDINSPTYINMQILVLGTLNFQSGQKINICPGGVYIAPGGSVSGGTAGSKINICGAALWNGPSALNGPASLGSTTLPVELISFTGRSVGQKVLLEWVTASETNNSHFIIERSVNGLDFTQAGVMAGSGTTSLQHSYSFSDAITGTNTIYYRLRQIDFNGQSLTYQPIAVETIYDETISTHLEIYPNPCTQQCQIILTANSDEESLTEIQLFDATGQRVNIDVFLGGINQALLKIESSDNLKPGVYIVKGISTSHIYFEKLVLN